jgi:pimeloyl-ACP methyl ester carboxylesterase
VLSHGNGFAIDAYFPFWRQLCSDFEVVLYDQRNHGQNPRHKVEAHQLHNFVNDMERVFAGVQAELGHKPATGVFHSISGVTSIWHALRYGKRWGAVLLFDPALIPGPGLPEHEVARTFELKLAAWSRNRPDGFSDPAQLAAQFQKSYSLRRWLPGAHDLMARSILRWQESTRDWRLCCPPEGESQVYKSNSDLHLTHRLNELPMPVALVCGDPDQPDAQAPCKVGRSLHVQYRLPYTAIPDTSHLLQIEKPTECVRAATSFLGEIGLLS